MPARHGRIFDTDRARLVAPDRHFSRRREIERANLLAREDHQLIPRVRRHSGEYTLGAPTPAQILFTYAGFTEARAAGPALAAGHEITPHDARPIDLKLLA